MSSTSFESSACGREEVLNIVQNPSTMSVKSMAHYLNIGVSKAYELSHRPDFPAALRPTARRIVISVDALNEWIRHEAEKPLD